MMKSIRWLAVCVLLAAWASDTALGVLNNGFNTDYVYALQTAWKDDKPDAGDVLMYNENTGAYMGKAVDFVADPDPNKQDWGWDTVTFAYDASGNARLFVARHTDIDPAYPLDQSRYRDIEVAEYNAGGGLVKSIQFADTLLGTSHMGGKVKVSVLRFSTYPGHADSLFMAVLTQANTSQPMKVYEFNLALTTLKNIYTGPACLDTPPRIDFNPNTGRMYVVGAFLNEPTKVLGRGDLIAFNYAPPGTNPTSYTKLIDGKIFVRRDDPDSLTDPGWPPARQDVSIWYDPYSVIYRGTDHEDGRETLIVSSSWALDNTKMPNNEFYLDQADSQGNLVRRNTFFASYFIIAGQLDRMTGSVWLARLYGYNSGLGLVRYDKNDKAVNTGIGANRGFSDVCSPGLAPMGAGWVVNNGVPVVNGVASVPIAQMPGPRIGFEDYVNIHANDYHLDVTQPWAEELDPVIAQGQAEGKPVIISDDNNSASNVASVQAAIARTTSVKGEHYEHYDPALGNTGLAHYGKFISSVSDFPADSLSVLTTLGTYASHLTPGGQLSVSGHEFLWNGSPVTLAGSSWMGALVTKMCDADGYLDVLASYGANLTRVWAIEQWTGTGMGTPGYERCSWLPFEGFKTPNTTVSPPETLWDLYALNDQYFARVREFVRKASARGIVVQLSLFDRAGVQCTTGAGVYMDSPYYDPNNLASIPFLTCGTNNHLNLLDMAPAPIWSINQAFVQRMVQEIGGYGNVIYEILNEPHNKWDKTLIINWHKAIADVVVGSYCTVPGQVQDPDPGNGVTKVSVTKDLSWTAGCGTNSYNVYFGTTNPPPAAGNQTQTVYDPGTMARRMTYYWRIDAVNANGTTAGPLWSFTTQSYPGDYDEDGDVDLTDFGFLQACFGTNGVIAPPECASADLDGDRDVDQSDFLIFSNCVNGTNQPPRTGCVSN